jgi:hypothetical protein
LKRWSSINKDLPGKVFSLMCRQKDNLLTFRIFKVPLR